MTKQSETTNHEIDLDKVSAKMKGIFSRANDSLFDFILFIKKNIIVIAVLFVLGAGYGYYKDHKENVYEQKILVTPNFESADYLYEQIKSINAIIADRDIEVLKKMGIKEPEKIAKLTIEPIPDIYNYVTEDLGLNLTPRENTKFNLFRQIADKRDMTEVLEEHVTAKNYKNHLITIITIGKFDKDAIVQPVMDYLNANSYFKEVQEKALKSLEIKIAENDTMIKQVDGILGQLSANGGGKEIVLLNQKTELNEMLVLKDQLVRQQAANEIKRITYKSIIKDTSLQLNNRKVSILSGKMKFIYPILLVGLFVLIMAFRSFYISQVNKRKA